MLGPTCVLLGLVNIALAAMEGYIVGGNFANILHHAHTAFLNANCISDTGETSSHICGASIVNNRILLSAAHCLHGCTSKSHFGINLGSENRGSGISYITDSFLIHEEYSPRTNINDISLLRVNRPLKFSRLVSRVALMRNPPYTERATVAGWGLVDEKREIHSERLKFITQTVWSRNHCLKVFRYLPRGTICAANENPDNHAARGDSGSALIVRGYIQIGLVSYNMPGIANHIIIYTDVGYFYDWIRFYAKLLYCIII